MISQQFEKNIRKIVLDSDSETILSFGTDFIVMGYVYNDNLQFDVKAHINLIINLINFIEELNNNGILAEVSIKEAKENDYFCSFFFSGDAKKIHVVIKIPEFQSALKYGIASTAYFNVINSSVQRRKKTLEDQYYPNSF
jgi:hypothetical protein